MPSNDPRLWDAYRATDYEVETSEGVVPIRIGRLHPRIDRLCVQERADSWCFLTAWNPGSQQLPAADNERRNEALQARLSHGSFVVLEGVGRGEDPAWPPEASFFVLGIDRERASRLGRRFGQNAIVYGARGEAAELVALV